MNQSDFTGVRITKRDYFHLPAHMRKVSSGLQVLSVVAGKEVFVPAIIID